MSRLSIRRRIERRTLGQATSRREDALAVEEPLDIRVAGEPYVVTMRTPGHDVELALGYLVSEGVIVSREQAPMARYCAGADENHLNTYNVLDVSLAPGVARPSANRSVGMTSSCGVCGKSSIDEVRTVSAFPQQPGLVIEAGDLVRLPQLLRASQQGFERTGGLHAAGLYDTVSGRMLVVREDVGRHNAVDKIVGWALQNNLLPLRNAVLMVSSRASFELTQKALMAGIPLLAAVSAPSSLAAELADESGLTLVGFLRDKSMVVYAGGERITDSSAPDAVGGLASVAAGAAEVKVSTEGDVA